MGDNSSMEIAAWLQGVGTVAAVIVALFLELFLVWWRRPRFDFTISLDPRDNDLSTYEREGHDQYVSWLRGKVHVTDGKVPALKVEVLVQDWRSPENQDVPFAHGNSFNWANSEDEVVRVAPGTWRRVDLLAWMASINEPGIPTLWIPLRSARGYPPRSWFHLTKSGDYELDLVVVADNSMSSRWCLKFTYAPRIVESIEDFRASVTNVQLVRR